MPFAGHPAGVPPPGSSLVHSFPVLLSLCVRDLFVVNGVVVVLVFVL